MNVSIPVLLDVYNLTLKVYFITISDRIIKMKFSHVVLCS